MAEQLSPSAQAVLDAMYEVNMDFDGENATLTAAALEVLADWVVPEESASLAKWPERYEVRRQILAIAAELKGDSNV